jgi:hypothetical protein
MILSFVEGEGNPEPFYQRFGFARTGEIVEGEHVMRLELADRDQKGHHGHGPGVRG